MKILLRIRFCGTAYAGFQFQPNAVTVQQRLNEACEAAFGEPCNVTGCSRTDSGVHANEFVCAVTPKDRVGFDENFSVPASRIHRVLNKYLPDDITVYGALFAEDGFHPRYSVDCKEYIYRIYDGLCPDPFRTKLVYHCSGGVGAGGIHKMNECAAIFEGTHDFRAFMASGSDITDTVRTVKYAENERIGDEIVFRVCADGFLYNMVRIMVGTLLDAAAGKVTVDGINEALRSGDRHLLGRTAPACGLYLNRVDYGAEMNWAAD